MPEYAVTHETIEIDRERDVPDAKMIRKYREYADGIQTRTLSEGQQSVLDGVTEHDFADNICDQILSEAANRLELQRFDCDNAAVTEWLGEFYIKGNIADLSNEVHYDVQRDGDTAISLRWDEGKKQVCLYLEKWWDGDTGVYVHYDDLGLPLYAVKDWDTPEGRRRVIWYEDRFERYIKQRGQMEWAPFALSSDPLSMAGQAVPIPWMKNDGSPLHIPVIHFSNNIRGRGYYGRSMLAGGILAFQDQINDVQYDLTGAGRLTAFQMVWMCGVNLKKDENDEPIAPKVKAGAVFHAASPDAKFGVLPAGDLSQLRELYMLKVRAACRMSRTPLHAITGDWPSGEALLRAEMPAINQARKQTTRLAPRWATVAHRATEIANVYARLELDEKAMITSAFAPPDKRDPLTLAETVDKIREDLSRRERLRQLGYQPADVERIMAELEDDASQSMTRDVQMQEEMTAIASANAMMEDE